MDIQFVTKCCISNLPAIMHFVSCLPLYAKLCASVCFNIKTNMVHRQTSEQCVSHQVVFGFFDCQLGRMMEKRLLNQTCVLLNFRVCKRQPPAHNIKNSYEGMRAQSMETEQ
ncbi:hypothetical protein SS50377_21724 [Spironucleus salmonicida]|uniref:Uncharacterized protein n=1 Tax=Spironucleus salmonicida TaxID=348837 RepID=V6LFB3_9EUKA|nr:hypothetical protein SS50377_21724 [Spironucleus salmonicida]|eukprot:EST43172.1 Hypothetical protein SS50377_17180 [Spironucleus salmonicida]